MGVAEVDTVRRAYGVFDTDLDALLGMLSGEVEWVAPPDSIEPGVRHGHDGVRRAYEATASAWERPTHTPEDVEEVGPNVLATVTFRGHGRGSGMDAERREYHVWTLRDGEIVRFEWFYDRDDAMAAARGA